MPECSIIISELDCAGAIYLHIIDKYLKLLIHSSLGINGKLEKLSDVRSQPAWKYFVLK